MPLMLLNIVTSSSYQEMVATNRFDVLIIGIILLVAAIGWTR